MTVPTAPTYSLAALIAARTAFRDLVDAGAGAGFIRVRNSAGVLLAQVPLVKPCGTVNGTTGVLTFALAGPDAEADATGTAAYAQVCDSTGLVHLALPALAGGSAVSGFFVMNSLSVLQGSPVEVLSAAIG
jgi:hypothetical protein